MLETIAETLDDQKTEHVMKAWEAALSFIMDHMKNPEDWVSMIYTYYKNL